VHSHKLGEGAEPQTSEAVPSGSQKLGEQAKLVDGKAGRLQLGIIQARELTSGAACA
jgi:hypothetical protein